MSFLENSKGMACSRPSYVPDTHTLFVRSWLTFLVQRIEKRPRPVDHSADSTAIGMVCRALVKFLK